MLQETVSHAVTQIDSTLIGEKREQVLPKIIVHQMCEEVIMKQFSKSSYLHCSFGVAYPASYRYSYEAREPADCALNLRDEDMDCFDMIAAEPR
jgi:hypothetical protein